MIVCNRLHQETNSKGTGFRTEEDHWACWDVETNSLLDSNTMWLTGCHVEMTSAVCTSLKPQHRNWLQLQVFCSKGPRINLTNRPSTVWHVHTNKCCIGVYGCVCFFGARVGER